MTENFYEKLRLECHKYCLDFHINPLDFLHNIICKQEITEENYRSLFKAEKMKMISDMKTHPLIHAGLWVTSVDDLIRVASKTRNKIPYYFYCYHCDLALPEHEMAGNGTKICKSSYNEKSIGRKRNSKNHNINMKKSAKKIRDNITDTYIKDLLRKNGVEITEFSIAEKRKSIIEKRKKRILGY